ncbi:hypothetical protein HK098_002770 [Nowakowskiella sp. JEL0407]|nr:hypothetical protein HK098_002770 [Nowakowskiella sp. JEL0407]
MSSEQSRPKITFAEVSPIAPAAEEPIAVVVDAKDKDQHEAPPEKQKKVDIDEHILPVESVIERYNANVNTAKVNQSRGLTAEDAKKRLEVNGPNVLTPPKKVHPFVKWLHCLSQIFNVLLVICAILTWVLYGIDPVGNSSNSYIGAILFAVALLNSTIEWYQLQKSAAILESFLNLIPSKCTAIRDGVLKQMPAADLVQGDVIHVRLGDKLPADILVLFASDFKVDNSSLTGEADPQGRYPRNTSQNPLEATNLAFNSTLCVSGEAFGLVIRTGDNTVIGQIATLTNTEAKRKSPLSQEIDGFVAIISTLAITSAIIFFFLAYFVVTKNDINFALVFSVGILVAWVPQGLPATVTLLLSIAAQRMANKNVLVKDLQGVETLGAITMLATDKTGTLTRNQMTVTNLWVSGEIYSASKIVLEGSSEKPLDLDVSGAKEIVDISSLCTRAHFDRTDIPIEERAIIGDATESGLYRFSAKYVSGDISTARDRFPVVFEIPFNSDNKWHMSIHEKAHPGGPLTQLIKGAPERVLRICSKILIDGQSVELTEERKKQFNVAYETMAGKGHRVLAFAQMLLDGTEFPVNFPFDKEEKNFPTSGLTFVGLASLEDPPKHGVREAIGHCREAGIKVMMVTGDHPLTAEAIGRKINLMISDTKEKIAQKTGRPIDSIPESDVYAIVVHGERIDELTNADWDNIFSKDEIIFARTSPKHKLQIVKHAQSLGHIVGVTGDGVNDSPALKKADLGISMNVSGSDVSKEAAAMILIDDNFASTVQGIAEGRLIFVNLRKSIQYVVTHILPEVIPYALFAIVPIPIALGPLQILAIDLGFELFVALSFAWEPPETETGLMKLPPRRPVNEDTIARLRERAAEEEALLPPSTDPDAPKKPVPFVKKVLNAVSIPFNGRFWKKLTQKSEGERLVDGELLSWVYIEGALIETVGCLTAFFIVLYDAKNPKTGERFGLTPYDAYTLQKLEGFKTTSPLYKGLTGDEQVEALAMAQSMFYLSILIIQLFNLFACKCRLTLPFGMYPLRNKFTWITIAGGVVFGMLIVYIPPLNFLFGTSWRLLPLYWLIPFAFGWFLLFYSALRRIIIRKFRPLNWNDDIEGLNMFPTRWSTARTRTKTLEN